MRRVDGSTFAVRQPAATGNTGVWRLSREEIAAGEVGLTGHRPKPHGSNSHKKTRRKFSLRRALV